MYLGQAGLVRTSVGAVDEIKKPRLQHAEIDILWNFDGIQKKTEHHRRPRIDLTLKLQLQASNESNRRFLRYPGLLKKARVHLYLLRFVDHDHRLTGKIEYEEA